ncbi:MAG: hypothetical protein HOY69_37990 [Streptomyces sp.]|nr:hypothetical protein [Streptomyces sp.]
MDWEQDASRTERIAALDARQRFLTAALALRRLRAAVLDVGLPADWGVPAELVGGLFATLAAEPTQELAEAVHGQVAELLETPVFGPFEMEPEFVEQVQLEALSGLVMMDEGLPELDVEQADYIVYRVRAMADYTDGMISDSLRMDPDEEPHQRYLDRLGAEVRAYGLGYFGSRNLEREFACHAAIVDPGSAGSFFTSAVGREQARLCDEFGAELVPVLRRFRSTDFPLS